MHSIQGIEVLRAAAQDYMELATQPIQEERRKLWSAHYSLKPVRPPISVGIGFHNNWCREYFSDANLKCQSPFLRDYERTFRMSLLQQTFGDDSVMEPWVTLHADIGDGWGGLWGIRTETVSTTSDGAWKHAPALVDLDEAARLQVPHHYINEQTTAQNLEQLQEAIGDIIPINVHRGPRCLGFADDIVTLLSMLRGLEQVMMDMYLNPEWLHGVMAFMRDGILTNHQEAEDAGDFTLSSHCNSNNSYADELEWPAPNSGARKRSELWAFCAAQEMTLVSPEMHDEFIFQYQMPIMAHFGLVHYGCCENLTKKIDMLRQLPNLRSIAVTPTADVAACAEQIKDDYAYSWRPNPTDMVTSSFEPDRIRKILRETLSVTRGCRMHISLKDIETVSGDVSRLPRWVDIVNEELDRAGY
jgi:hypothetical protein